MKNRIWGVLLGLLISLSAVSAQSGGWVWQNNGSTLTTSTPNNGSAVTIWNKNASGCTLTLKSGAAGTTVISVCGTTFTISGNFSLGTANCYGWSTDTFLERTAAGSVGVAATCGGAASGQIAVGTVLFSGGQSLVGTTASVTTVQNASTAQTFRFGATTTTGVSTVPLGDGIWKLSNYGISAGVTINVATDSILKIFARDGTSAGTFQVGSSTDYSLGGGTRLQSLRTGADASLRLTRASAHDWDLFGGASQFRLNVDGGDLWTVTSGGQFGFFSDATHGFLVNTTADNVAAFVSRAGADTATVKANVFNGTGAFQSNGTPGVTCASAGTVSSTLGIVTACSAPSQQLYGSMWQPFVQHDLAPILSRLAAHDRQIDALMAQVSALEQTVRSFGARH